LSFALKAPAKINWSLSVIGKRQDGYHDVVTLMQCLSIWDSLTFALAERLEVITEAPIPPESNLVYRAAMALRGVTGSTLGARITLDKRIPLGAGLGGGSSDAAAALAGLNRLWDLGLDRRALMEVGGGLGSDVPFFFLCPLARAEGRGDLLTPVSPATRQTLLVVKPSFSVSTAWAYAELAASRSGGSDGGAAGGCAGEGERAGADRLTRTQACRDNINLICKALAEGDLRQLEARARNDFEEVITRQYPEVGRIKAGLKEAGASLALMSGSGSAVFGVFRHRDEARRASTRFPSHWTSMAETLCQAL
jgi:4-diphosphocytidyl-2-C-methyl-D-erythritol kinase